MDTNIIGLIGLQLDKHFESKSLLKRKAKSKKRKSKSATGMPVKCRSASSKINLKQNVSPSCISFPARHCLFSQRDKTV